MSFNERNNVDVALQGFFSIFPVAEMWNAPVMSKNKNVKFQTYSRDFTFNRLVLDVVRGSNIEVNPLWEMKTTELNRNSKDKKHNYQFYNNGDGGIKFKIDVIIGNGDTWRGKYVTDALHELMTNGTRLFVVTDATDIPNGEYVITRNPSRKQEFQSHTVWTLEFMTHNPLLIWQYSNNLKSIKTAIKNYNTAKYNASPQGKLRKCNVKNLKYKKKNTCCGYLNTVLYTKGYINKKTMKKMIKNKHETTFTDTTVKAVKKFQKEYKKKYKLSVNGQVDKKTRNALAKI